MLTPQQQAQWRQMVGLALLWAGLAALVALPGLKVDGLRLAGIAGLGFVAFALGLGLFAEGLQRGLVERLRRAGQLQR